MSTISGIGLIAFDFYGTLVRNDDEQWVHTLNDIAMEQELAVDGERLWQVWRTYEVEFRKTRTNMRDLEASPPFRTYFQAWREAFVKAFAALELAGDADAAALRCVDELARRDAFSDAGPVLKALSGRYRLAVMSNADDRFLLGGIRHNGWQFDVVVSSEQARAYKPDPRAFAALFTPARVDPADMLYVGDSAYDDVHGAKLAGMRAVLVRRDQLTPGRTPPPDAAELLEPDYVMDSLDGLLPLLL